MADWKQEFQLSKALSGPTKSLTTAAARAAAIGSLLESLSPSVTISGESAVDVGCFLFVLFSLFLFVFVC